MSSENSPPTRGPDLANAERKSFSLLQRYSIDEPGFDIEDLAYAMDITVREGGLEDADAWLFRRKNGKGIIRLNSSTFSRQRRRFSIAHELGHWEMHPNLKQGKFCTAEDLSDYIKSPEEIEANWFAATLLMPRFMIRDYITRGDADFNLIDRITDEFETSRTAAARRFIELTTQRAILVSSTDGKVNWHVKSHAAKFYALESMIVLPESLTARVVRSKKNPAESESLAPEIWLRENPVQEIEELFEDVRYSERLNTALTLLWFP
jgi:Zn-dependent peptidase ImmA (M78 family)